MSRRDGLDDDRDRAALSAPRAVADDLDDDRDRAALSSP
jgi:hypothetical protein